MNGPGMAELDYLDRAVLPDPYPWYRWLREHDPAHDSADLGGVVISRYDDVVAVLRDHERLSSRIHDDPLVPNAFATDPPEHTGHRRAMGAALASQIDRTGEDELARLADQALDRSGLANGAFDAAAGFAYPYALHVTVTRMGVPPEQAAELRRWADLLVAGLSPMGTPILETDDLPGLAEMVAFFHELAADRLAHPGNDLLSALAVEAGASGASAHDIAVASLSLLNAHVNTAQLLTQAINLLANQHHHLDQLSADPTLVRPFVTELLRHDPPVQFVVRRAVEELELGGRSIRAGTTCVLALGAANRDPTFVTDPERFDPARGASRSLAFSGGIHACLGAALAVQEVTIGLRCLLDRCDRLVPDAGRPARPSWSDGLRGFTSLPIVTHDRPQAASHRLAARGRRSAAVLAFSGRTALDAAIVGVRRTTARGDKRAALEREFHARTARELFSLMGDMKGAAMKVGQMLSFMDLGLPPAYQEVLANLQTRGGALDPAAVAAVIAEDLGRPPAEVFSSFSAEPVATASIGQVHRARLADGRDVAVKVQYPGMATAIAADFDNSELVGVIVQLLSRLAGFDLDVRALGEEARLRISEEVDYRREALMQAEFRRRFTDDPDIHVPEVMFDHCGDRVLVTEWVDGHAWRDTAGADQATRDRWGLAIYRYVYQSLYQHGFFNGDPHPGNYLFLDDGRVSFLDYGCVQRFSHRELSGLRDAARAILAGDRDALFEAFQQLGYIVPGRDYDPERIFAWAEQIFRPALADEGFTFTPEYARDVFRRHFDRAGEWNDVLTRFDYPRSLLFLNRINLGLPSVLGGLHASARWRDVIDAFVLDQGAPGAAAVHP